MGLSIWKNSLKGLRDDFFFNPFSKMLFLTGAATTLFFGGRGEGGVCVWKVGREEVKRWSSVPSENLY